MTFVRTNFSFFLFLSILLLLIGCSSDDSDAETETEITITASDFLVTIDENPGADQSLGTIDATTNSGSLSFSIIEQSVENAFRINAATGELNVATPDAFDFETNTEITGSVTIDNSGLSENVSVIIILNDVLEANIYTGDVILTSQEEVNDFGAQNYDEIDGNLRISSNDNVLTSLIPLNTLTAISGDFLVENNNNLTTLEGLNNIITIGENLWLSNNLALIDINHLNNLVSVGQRLRISNNDILEIIDGFEGLEFVGDDFFISSNNALLEIQGINNLTTIQNSFILFSNPSITSCTGLNSLNTIGASFRVLSNYELTNLDGMQNLDLSNNLSENIKDIRIEANSFENLNFLQNTTAIEGNLYIGSNADLLNLDGLQALESISGRIDIEHNYDLENLDAMSTLSFVGWQLIIFRNFELYDLCGLQNLLIENGLHGGLSIDENAYNPTEQDIIDGNCSI